MRSILKDTFEKIYCINLDSRLDKWKSVTEEFKKYNIEDIVERYPGHTSKGNSCGRGCSLSYFNLLKKCKNDKINQVLVFEDDVEFLTFSLDYINKKNIKINSNPADILYRGLTQLKKIKWDIFYLGFNIKLKEFCHKEILSDNLFKATNQLTTHSVAFNNSVYDVIIEDFLRSEFMIDTYLGYYLSHKINSINLYPMITGQKTSFTSDITHKKSPNKWIHKNVLHNFMNYEK